MKSKLRTNYTFFFVFYSPGHRCISYWKTLISTQKLTISRKSQEHYSSTAQSSIPNFTALAQQMCCLTENTKRSQGQIIPLHVAFSSTGCCLSQQSWASHAVSRCNHRSSLQLSPPEWIVQLLLTLCPGSRWVPPGGPTTKWTSAIKSLLNITAFLQTEVAC